MCSPFPKPHLRILPSVNLPKPPSSEDNFAVCLLLEIPMRGFPFQINSSEKYRIPKNNQIVAFEKEVPSGGSQAGGVSQKHILSHESSGRGPERYNMHMLCMYYNKPYIYIYI